MNWMKAARVWSFALVVAIFAAMLAYADLDKVAAAFSGIKWRWAIWVPILNLANTLVEALRLAVILFPVKKKLTVRNSFNSSLIGIIGNVLLPLRFGDGVRAYYIAKTEKIGLAGSLSALMLDRVADFLVFFFLVALTAFLHPFPPSVTKMALAAGAIFAGAVAAIFALAGIGRRIGRNPAGTIRLRIADEVNKFMGGLAAMQNAGLLLPILLFSALSWLLRAAMIWCMFEAFGLDLPIIATPITLILLNLGIAVVSTPANLGGFELATVGALKLFSVDIAPGLSYALALHVIEVVPMVAFGVVFLWFEGFKTKEVLKSVKEMRDKREAGAPAIGGAPLDGGEPIHRDGRR
ncbi:MAG: lysylphosphatidylglycerol synthase transmembrane domain-containing protein [Syntrophobacteraceae bacterium]